MAALEYHEATKHHFNRFARSAGHLDWANQPDPFRRFTGAPIVTLPRDVVAEAISYDALFDGSPPAEPMTHATVAELLRCSMGLSAWKQYQASRWALRVNPSSGNLHPTETYMVWNGSVSHYAPREHVLEERCVYGPGAAGAERPRAGASAPASVNPREWLLVGFSSIFWREAWKYGERAFRYCQHDLGHAVAALSLSAARLGWQTRLLSDWTDREVSALLGLDRSEDFADAEREAAECLVLVTSVRGVDRTGQAADASSGVESETASRASLLRRVAEGTWAGRANRLSRSHVSWPAIDEVAAATEYRDAEREMAVHVEAKPLPRDRPGLTARTILLQRRSAVAFDGRSTLTLGAFAGILARLRADAVPGTLFPWLPQVHLALFVHRVSGLAPGIYAFLRGSAVVEEWRAAMRPQFLWEPCRDEAGILREGELRFLLPFDMTWPATRVSCDQDIAGDGFFSVAMLGRAGAVRTRGESFYRRLFWEAGAIGQLLYLEAEAAGARGTGIGCFYDDAVHELLGLTQAEPDREGGSCAATSAMWQSLYHFAVGQPVDDERLTTEPGYEWER